MRGGWNTKKKLEGTEIERTEAHERNKGRKN